MGAGCRREAAKLRQKYARLFDVSLEKVVIREWPDDSAHVSCPTRQDLPVWDTGVVTK